MKEKLVAAGLMITLAVGCLAVADSGRNAVREREERTAPDADRQDAEELLMVEEVPCEEDCAKTYEDCKKWGERTCKDKHPRAGTRAFNRVTRWEENKACEVVCQTYYGDQKLYGCVREKKKPVVKGPVTLPVE